MDCDEAIRREIEALLRRTIGLNPESVGSRTLARAITKGMRSSDAQTLSDYLLSLQNSSGQLDSLIESVVVSETSFFRNRASFFFLRQWITSEWRSVKENTDRVLRVLSLPCSTGEEPYSIAITLLEEGLMMDDFHLDGVDISLQAISKATQGVYSPYAFRRQGYRSDDKYFSLVVPKESEHTKPTVSRYSLTEAVREKVNFYQGNMLDPQLLSDQPPYDVIFCRNLLIYFDQKARDRTFTKLDSLLRPNGLLFFGYAEASLIDSQRYKPVAYPDTYAYYNSTKNNSTKNDHSPLLSSSAAISG